MASLPSFVELMASLGLEQRPAPAPAVVEQSSSSQPPSLPGSPLSGSSNVPSRSSSSPSLRDVASRHRMSRFSPYSPCESLTRRRGSLSSVSSSSDFESSPLSATFYVPPRSTVSRPRRYRNKLTVNTYGSSSDLNGETPISTYVRRKTPGTSPSSPSFNPADSGYESSSPAPMPFSIPSLPVLLPHSASTESFPDTHSSDIDIKETGRVSPLADITGTPDYYRFIRRRTGTRISRPSAFRNPTSTSKRKQTVDMES